MTSDRRASQAMRSLALGAALCAFAGQARATDLGNDGASSTVSTAPSANMGQTTAIYRVYNHGLHVVDATADYTLTDLGYGITTRLHAGGFMSLFLRMDIQSTAQGHFDHDWVHPVGYESAGYSRGRHRSVVLHYDDDAPHVVTLDPKESDREDVPQGELSHAMDTLSAMALLLENVRHTGKCDGNAHVFDGLRLSAMTSHGPFKGEVPETFGQKFKGPALRCDFVGQQEAGFIKDSSHLEVMKAPHPGSAWFQDIPGVGLTAVRIEFEHPKLGQMTAVLDHTPVVQP
ncbi:DUF3108 domain-containing protein [Asaia krungthepensis]|uniref:DUF3108 domain-containing protein n=1 Tax=Asaia krungthepensis NRIC 0535 TaxID=1307925 RepID=A0ABQ0PXE5_9PROT|nr:DUF3108 domain-containing protein [Asaia krungthepensis]GBQ83927.1 hypothetical protein AA0535_0372 [Asaia krungthepensis NRIC 0535]